MSHRLACPPLDHPGSGLGFAERVGAPIDGIGQEAQQRAIGRLRPDGGAAGLILAFPGQRDAFPMEPQQHLTGTGQLGHLGEYQ